MGLIRGGRVIVDDLRASMAAIQAYRMEAQEALIRNPRKAQLALDDMELVEREIERLITDVLEPMLKKRDVRGERDLADVAERIGQLEARMVATERTARAVKEIAEQLADLQARLAAVERGERAPIPLRKRES